MRSIIKNKKGQFEGILLAVITLFIIGLILFLFNHVNEKMYSEFDEYFEGSKFNNTEAHNVLEDIQGVEQSRIWDFAFLAIYIGIIMQMLILAFASRANVAFFWIFVLLGLVILIVGTILSNIWQEVVINPEFSETIGRFTITNTLLGTFFPMVITGLIFLALIIIFGKFPGGRNE